jgi:hypothetical protein
MSHDVAGFAILRSATRPVAHVDGSCATSDQRNSLAIPRIRRASGESPALGLRRQRSQVRILSGVEEPCEEPLLARLDRTLALGHHPNRSFPHLGRALAWSYVHPSSQGIRSPAISGRFSHSKNSNVGARIPSPNRRLYRSESAWSPSAGFSSRSADRSPGAGHCAHAISRYLFTSQSTTAMRNSSHSSHLARRKLS